MQFRLRKNGLTITDGVQPRLRYSEAPLLGRLQMVLGISEECSYSKAEPNGQDSHSRTKNDIMESDPPPFVDVLENI